MLYVYYVRTRLTSSFSVVVQGRLAPGALQDVPVQARRMVPDGGLAAGDRILASQPGVEPQRRQQPEGPQAYVAAGRGGFGLVRGGGAIGRGRGWYGVDPAGPGCCPR